MTDSERVSEEFLISHSNSDGKIGQMARELIEARTELAWVRDVMAEHGYDGPQGEACSPLRDWLIEWKAQKAELAMLRERAREIHWTAHAFAALGYIRDKMPPSEVVAVQDFLDKFKPERAAILGARP